jgi:conjugal transfer pilus assembly protein TraL
MSQKNDQHVIIKSLDNLPRFLFWSLDDFLVMVIPFFIGMVMESLLVMVMGVLIRPFYSKLKRRYPHGSLKHFIYWYFPHEACSKSGCFKNLPPSHKRERLL